MDVLVYRLVQWCPGQSWGVYGCSRYIGWSSGFLDNPGISMDVLVYRLVQWCLDNPGISMNVLVYRLVQWCHGQSWDIYGYSSI